MNNISYNYYSEQQLIDDLINKREDAWRKIITEYTGFLIALVRKTHLNYGIEIPLHDAEDIVAEIWQNLLENDMRVLRVCQDRNNFFPTLSVLARNRSIDRIRKQKLAFVELNEEFHSKLPDDSNDALFSQISSAKLMEFINELPYKQKVIINLFFLQGKHYKEIETLTGISQNSIGPTLYRAIQQLKQKINNFLNP